MKLNMRRIELRLALRALVSARSGGAALEFALVAPPFLLLILSALELGFFYTRLAAAETAVSRAARFVYIGAAANDDTITQASIEQFICDESSFFGANCADNVAVELRPVDDLAIAASDDATCRSSSDEVTPTITFDPGGSSQVMIMKACFTMDLINPMFGWSRSLTQTADGRFQLVLNTAFMNEPF